MVLRLWFSASVTIIGYLRFAAYTVRPHDNNWQIFKTRQMWNQILAPRFSS